MDIKTSNDSEIKYLTLPEYAESRNLDLNVVYNRARRGNIEGATKIDGRWMVPEGARDFTRYYARRSNKKFKNASIEVNLYNRVKELAEGEDMSTRAMLSRLVREYLSQIEDENNILTGTGTVTTFES